jgi:hypothetical protein
LLLADVKPDHDVFISYSHQDSAWVGGELVPSLTTAGLTVFIDTGEILIGEILRERLKQGVSHSRHTVIVLTPDWLKSEWCQYEEQLASANDPLRRRRNVLPLLLKPCSPGRGLDLLVYADFTIQGRRGAEMERLIRSLQPRPASDGGRGNSAAVRGGLEALCKLMQRQSVRDAVIASRSQIAGALPQIEVLRGYKDLHDQLHRLDREFYNSVHLEAEGFPGDERARRHIESSRLTLDKILRDLRSVAGRATLAAEETDWIERDFAPAHADLGRALEQSDAQLFRCFLGSLRRVLQLQPSRIDDLLFASARTLRLPDLVRAMQAVFDKLYDPELDPELVRNFEAGVDALAELNQSLAYLLGVHRRWQDIDLVLHMLEFSLAQGKEIEISWPSLHPRIEQLCQDVSEPWAAALQTDCGLLASALTERNPRKISDSFQNCRRRAGLRFYEVDCDLKDQCKELSDVGIPLKTVLEVMR